MSLGKKDIIKNIKAKAHLDLSTSTSILNFFLSFIKQNKSIKISNFGSFRTHTSQPRIGRNPLTKEEYSIPVVKKLSFKASAKAKSFIN